MNRSSLIFGSSAIKHWYSDFRTPKDVDYMCQEPCMTKDVQNYWIPSFQTIIDRNLDNTYIDPDLLLTIKASHAGWDIHWSKTMGDILFLKSKGHKIDRDLYHQLVKDWIKVHGKKWASLKKKNSETFFVDGVQRKYVHDDIHEAVSVYDKPLYEKLLSEGVSCSEEGFERLSFEDKLLLVKEEAWVTAIERFLIPKNFKTSQQLAYWKSLKKLMTTMSSGWFKFFMIDNYEYLYKNDDVSYITKFKEAEQQNKLRYEQIRTKNH